MRHQIIVHRNAASPLPMYFYALKEHNHPENEEFPGHPGLWYGLYVLPESLAEKVQVFWHQFHRVVAIKQAVTCSFGRDFIVDVGLPMYVSLNERNIDATFAVSEQDRKEIRTKMLNFFIGDEQEYAPREEEVAFINSPYYFEAFKLTKRAQGLKTGNDERKVSEIVRRLFEKERSMPYSRTDAAAVLAKVAETTEYGGFPEEVTPFELGRAVHRTVMNAREEGNGDDIIGEFFRGFFDRPC